jgi:hypothetical protein
VIVDGFQAFEHCRPISDSAARNSGNGRIRAPAELVAG